MNSRGSNRFIYKYHLLVDRADCKVDKKFCSINQLLDEYGETLKLNRQKIYRLRKDEFSKNEGTTATALKKYEGITILDIREKRKTKTVIKRILVDDLVGGEHVN